MKHSPSPSKRVAQKVLDQRVIAAERDVLSAAKSLTNIMAGAVGVPESVADVMKAHWRYEEACRVAKENFRRNRP